MKEFFPGLKRIAYEGCEGPASRNPRGYKSPDPSEDLLGKMAEEQQRVSVALCYTVDVHDERECGSEWVLVGSAPGTPGAAERTGGDGMKKHIRKHWARLTRRQQFLSGLALACVPLLVVIGIAMAAGPDSDGDGMSDDFENFFGLDPDSGADAALDYDSDNLDNLGESAVWTDPWIDSVDSNPLSRAVFNWGDANRRKHLTLPILPLNWRLVATGGHLADVFQTSGSLDGSADYRPTEVDCGEPSSGRAPSVRCDCDSIGSVSRVFGPYEPWERTESYSVFEFRGCHIRLTPPRCEYWLSYLRLHSRWRAQRRTC